jgi:uncharacterized protein (TIGR02246 family)
MMKSLSWIGLVALNIAGVAAASGPSDEAKIRALEQQQAVAWNAHDINAYSALFTSNAHVINVLGWHWRSRSELQQKLGRAFGSVFARSQLTITDADVDFPKPDIAVAHVRWTMTGALSPTGAEGSAPQLGIQTQVLVRSGGSWRIAHFQNTNSVPERPFPPSR